MIARFDPDEMRSLATYVVRREVTTDGARQVHRKRHIGARPDIPPIAPITWSFHLRRSHDAP